MIITIWAIIAGIWLVTTVADCFSHEWDKSDVLSKDFMILMLIADIVYMMFKYAV